MSTADGDAELLAELARLYTALDPPPAGLADRILFALELDGIDHELARIEERLVGADGARSAEHSSTVTFASDSLTVMITIMAVPTEGVRLDGWAAPADAVSVELRTGQGSRFTTTSSAGRFEFDGLAHGRVQLVFHDVRQSGGQVVAQVVTPAVEI